MHVLAAIRRGVQEGLDLHYTIAGAGPFLDAITSKVSELDLRDRVTMLGTISSEEVEALLDRIDAFVLASTGQGEAWPVSIMEAMGAGLPVIASRIGATPEMITPGVDGFLIGQRDEDALLESIGALANDLELRLRIGSAARNTTLQRFDVSATASALRDAIYASEC